MATPPAPKTILLVGASRGLGQAMAAEYVKRGWTVIGAVRGADRTPLHDLADANPGRVSIETLDILDPAQIAALQARLTDRKLDALFVNAGVTNNPAETVADVTTDEFVRVMVTNALSPMKVIEALEGLVAADGLIGVMSSGQGSVTNNTVGMREVYRSSKAALNQFMRSFAARHAGDPRAMVVMAPGWVRTDMGGSQAPLTIADSIPSLVNVLLAQHGQPGLR